VQPEPCDLRRAITGMDSSTANDNRTTQHQQDADVMRRVQSSGLGTQSPLEAANARTTSPSPATTRTNAMSSYLLPSNRTRRIIRCINRITCNVQRLPVSLS